jgi:hypothetical protein
MTRDHSFWGRNRLEALYQMQFCRPSLLIGFLFLERNK